jgi:hypothetical protein
MEWRTYRACSWTPIAFGNDVTHQQLRLFRVHDLIHLRVASWVGGELNAYGMIPVLAHAQLEDLDELGCRTALSPRHVRRLGRPRETQHERGHGAIYVGGRKQLGASSYRVGCRPRYGRDDLGCADTCMMTRLIPSQPQALSIRGASSRLRVASPR